MSISRHRGGEFVCMCKCELAERERESYLFEILDVRLLLLFCLLARVYPNVVVHMMGNAFICVARCALYVLSVYQCDCERMNECCLRCIRFDGCF